MKSMYLQEKTIASQKVFEGRIVNVLEDKALLSNSAEVLREVVEHPGGVCILPVDENGDCYLIHQFRYAFHEIMLEAPAGMLEPGEEPRTAAVRELSEETGITADQIIYAGVARLSPGYSTEVTHLFLAFGLHFGASHPDENELLNVEKVSLEEMLGRVDRNEIRDAKTELTILRAERERRKQQL